MKMAALSETRTAPVREDHVSGVYHYAARQGGIEALDAAAAELGIGIPELSDAVGHLVESRLLMSEQPAGNRLVPVDLEVAAASLVSSAEREIYRRRALIDQIRDRVELLRRIPGGVPGAAEAPGGDDFIVGSLEVQGFLREAGDLCRAEALVLRSTEQSGEALARAYLPLLRRGVAVRIVCQHRSRADLAESMQMRRLLEAGAAVATVSQVPRSAVVFDRSVTALLGPDDGEASLTRVRSDVVIRFLLDLFDHLWESATPLEAAETGYADVADDLQQSIVKLMAKGYTDEVVARKLGMSVRSCRRHIAALMRELGATSRFQAGVQAARRFLPEDA